MTNTYAHSKMVLAGYLTTDSLIRTKVKELFVGNRNDEMMAYLYSQGLAKQVTISDIGGLLEKTLGKIVDTSALFPLPLDYDQQNCEYKMLLGIAEVMDLNS